MTYLVPCDRNAATAFGTMSAVGLLSVIGLLMCGVVGEDAVHDVSAFRGQGTLAAAWLIHAGPVAAHSTPTYVAAQGYVSQSPISEERPPSSPSAEAVGGNESQPPEEPAPPSESLHLAPGLCSSECHAAGSMLAGSVHITALCSQLKAQKHLLLPHPMTRLWQNVRPGHMHHQRCTAWEGTHHLLRCCCAQHITQLLILIKHLIIILDYQS